ncbi:hypothetical protein HYX02_08275 [Candidatus Woesearchaeota archaeon]|nr:hypothetical protein [Candidatus Woesearchaeota archaeon]
MGAPHTSIGTLLLAFKCKQKRLWLPHPKCSYREAPLMKLKRFNRYVLEILIN